METALPPSTLATPQPALDDKAPATIGTLDEHPPSLPVLDEASTPLEDQEEESSKLKVKETVEEPTLPLLPTHPLSAEQPSSHLDDQEEGPELPQTVESPISTVNDNEEEKSQPTTKSMDEKSSSSFSVEVLPTAKSRETIPHSIQVYKPPRKTDAEMYTDTIDLDEFIMQRKREGKGVDTQSVDESTQELGAKTYLHLELGLVQPTVDLVQPPVSIDEYLVQTGLIERPFRELSVKPVENYESFPYRPTKVKGKWLEPRKPAGIQKFVFISPFQPGNIGEDLPTPEPFQAQGETGGDDDESLEGSNELFELEEKTTTKPFKDVNVPIDVDPLKGTDKWGDFTDFQVLNGFGEHLHQIHTEIDTVSQAEVHENPKTAMLYPGFCRFLSLL